MPKRSDNGYSSGTKRTRYAAATRARAPPPITRAPTTTRPRTPRAELKDYSAFLFNATPINTTGQVSPIATYVPTGDDAQSRDGRIILAKTFNLRMHFRGAINTTGETTSTMRCVVVRWDDDIPPQWSDMFNASSVTATYNLDNVYKMKVLEDRLFCLNSNFADSSGDAAPVQYPLAMSIPLNYQMQFNDSTNRQEKGSIYVAVIADTANWTEVRGGRSQLLFYDV